MNTLFDTAEFSVKPRLVDGSYCTARTKKAIDRLRTCIIGEVRRRDCFWKQMRMKDEEIKRLKAALSAKFSTFEEYDRLAKLF